MELTSGVLFYVPIFIVFYLFKIRKFKLRKQLLWITFYIYICAVIDLTMFPLPVNLATIEYRRNSFDPAFSQLINLQLHIEAILTKHFWLNVLMCIPFGLFINLLSTKEKGIGLMKTVGYTFLFSLSIEFIQLLLLYFINKIAVPDVDDLFANTIGGLVGYLLFYGYLKMIVFCKQLWSKSIENS